MGILIRRRKRQPKYQAGGGVPVYASFQVRPIDFAVPNLSDAMRSYGRGANHKGKQPTTLDNDLMKGPILLEEGLDADVVYANHLIMRETEQLQKMIIQHGLEGASSNPQIIAQKNRVNHLTANQKAMIHNSQKLWNEASAKADKAKGEIAVDANKHVWLKKLKGGQETFEHVDIFNLENKLLEAADQGYTTSIMKYDDLLLERRNNRGLMHIMQGDYYALADRWTQTVATSVSHNDLVKYITDNASKLGYTSGEGTKKSGVDRDGTGGSTAETQSQKDNIQQLNSAITGWTNDLLSSSGSSESRALISYLIGANESVKTPAELQINAKNYVLSILEQQKILDKKTVEELTEKVKTPDDPSGSGSAALKTHFGNISNILLNTSTGPIVNLAIENSTRTRADRQGNRYVTSTQRFIVDSKTRGQLTSVAGKRIVDIDKLMASYNKNRKEYQELEVERKDLLRKLGLNEIGVSPQHAIYKFFKNTEGDPNEIKLGSSITTIEAHKLSNVNVVPGRTLSELGNLPASKNEEKTLTKWHITDAQTVSGLKINSLKSEGGVNLQDQARMVSSETYAGQLPVIEFPNNRNLVTKSVGADGKAKDISDTAYSKYQPFSSQDTQVFTQYKKALYKLDEKHKNDPVAFEKAKNTLDKELMNYFKTVYKEPNLKLSTILVTFTNLTVPLEGNEDYVEALGGRIVANTGDAATNMGIDGDRIEFVAMSVLPDTAAMQQSGGNVNIQNDIRIFQKMDNKGFGGYSGLDADLIRLIK